MGAIRRLASARGWLLHVLVALVSFGGALVAAGGIAPARTAASTPLAKVYLPLVMRPAVCQAIPGESYGVTPVTPELSSAETHPDLNLAVRGYSATSAPLQLVDYNGESDPGAPQLPGLFADNRTATFRTAYQMYDWDWTTNTRGPLLATWPVTLLGLAATPGETIHVPDSVGRDIGDDQRYEVLVLYASLTRITLKYTRDDNVRAGYTLHVEGVCVEPSLLSLYQSWNAAGRGRLPGLRARQAFGRADGNEIGVAIRDCGSFMDPRSRKDWWQGR